MEIEDRRDGIALSDRYGDCTDIGLPEAGTDGHATLLAAEYLGGLRHERPGEIIPFAVVEQYLAEQAQQFRKFWRSRDATAPGSEQAPPARSSTGWSRSIWRGDSSMASCPWLPSIAIATSCRSRCIAAPGNE